MKEDLKEDFYNPYAFIPLSEKVFSYTEEEKKAFEFAQDIPFKDGLSGKIHVKMIAKTPFIVKDVKEEKQEYYENYNIIKEDNKQKKYFIPATSLKGMIRSVFEIITLSNIRNYMADNRYSIRDLKSDNYSLKKGEQKSGLLIELKNKYYIIPCESVKVPYETIKEEERVDIKCKKTIEEKYNSLKEYIFETVDDKTHIWFFSGYMENKENEYDFTIPDLKEDKLIDIEEDVLNDFLFIHNIENKNKSWEFWKKKLKNYNNISDIKADNYKGIVPCFFRTKIKEEKTVVKDFGFSFLYRQPYPKKLTDCLPQQFKNKSFDMAQALFGYVENKDALKGRVQFTNAYIEKAELEKGQTFVLGSPHATYYPFYLEQNNNKLNDYFSKDAKIAGWKRMLIHKNAKKGGKTKNKTTSSFSPLKAGTSFSFDIYFHNLHHYEIGALLSALTFCNHEECYHSLGYAKPFGYGKIKLEDLKIDIDQNTISPDKLIQSFKDKICSQTELKENEWNEQIKSLFIIAAGEYGKKEIRYPELKDFNYIKKHNMSLKNFSPENLYKKRQ